MYMVYRYVNLVVSITLYDFLISCEANLKFINTALQCSTCYNTDLNITLSCYDSKKFYYSWKFYKGIKIILL